MVNGTSAHALEYDDYFLGAMTHTSGVLFAALLAVGCERGASGQALLDAYAVGVEVQVRLLGTAFRSHYSLGWHATSTLGCISSAAAVSKLSGASAQEICNAMSVAFSLAGGTKLQFGTSTKFLHAGFAAHSSVLAASLAQAGVDGHPGFIEEKWGFRDLYLSSNQKHISGDDVFGDLGYVWAIETHGPSMKRFPCSAASHRVLDGLEAMLKKVPVKLEDIKSVRVDLPDIRPVFKVFF